VTTRSGNLDRTANTAVPADPGKIPDSRVFTQSLPSGKAAAIHLFTNGPSPAGQIRHTPVNPVAVGYHHRTHAPARIVLPVLLQNSGMACELRFGRVDGLRQDRGLCLFVCCI
jgi:hypothetical protein